MAKTVPKDESQDVLYPSIAKELIKMVESDQIERLKDDSDTEKVHEEDRRHTERLKKNNCRNRMANNF